MERYAYDELREKLASVVDGLNSNKGILNKIYGKEYHFEAPTHEDFIRNYKEIMITSSTSETRKQKTGTPIIVKIHRGLTRGIDGLLMTHKKEEIIKELIHSFARKYGITTGFLL